MYSVPSQYAWIVGVFLAALASLISNLGVTLQKLLHNNNADKGNDQQEYYKHPMWWLGLSLIVLGSLADFSALSFSPQSLIAPLGSLTLVSNVIFAPYLLKEKITKRDLMGTFFIILGCFVSVAFADHVSVQYKASELFHAFLEIGFEIYLLLVIMFIITLRMFISKMENAEPESEYYQSNILYLRFAYPAISGAVGAQSVLFAKCSVELLTNALYGVENTFKYPQTYLIIASMFTTIFLQIKWLNQGLLLFDASYLIPVFQAFWILLSVVSGLMFYKEIDDMSSVARWFFFLGVLFTLFGVLLLSQHRGKHTGQGATGSTAEFGRLRTDELDEHDGDIFSDDDDMLDADEEAMRMEVRIPGHRMKVSTD